MITRSEVLDSGRIGEGEPLTEVRARGAEIHRRYYAQLVNERTISHVLSVIPRALILSSTDEHFNDIPLSEWDVAGCALPLAMRFETLGDYATKAGLVCVAKEAAKQWKEKQTTSTEGK